MSPTRKPVRVTIALTSAAAPRAAEPIGPKSQAYPTAVELLEQSAGWRGWLEQSLRAVLRPVALAGAVGLAAAAGAGCGGEQANTPEPRTTPPTVEPMNVAGGQVAVVPGPTAQGDPQGLEPKPPEPGSMIAPVPMPVAIGGTQAAVVPPPEPIPVPGGDG